MAALAAGLVEMGIRGADGWQLRLTIYAVVVAVALRMRAGKRWARTTLALGLGVVGMASLLAEPIAFVLSANPFHPTLELAGIVAARIVHIGAVLAALVCMYRRPRERVAADASSHPVAVRPVRRRG